MPAGFTQIQYDVNTAPNTIVFQGTSTGGPATITVSEAVAAGDTILVAFLGTVGTAPTDNAAGGSNTYVAINTSLGASSGVLYGCVSAKAASAGTLVITPPATVSKLGYAHYSGGVSSFDAATTAATGSGTPRTPGTSRRPVAARQSLSWPWRRAAQASQRALAIRCADRRLTPPRGRTRSVPALARRVQPLAGRLRHGGRFRVP